MSSEQICWARGSEPYKRLCHKYRISTEDIETTFRRWVAEQEPKAPTAHGLCESGFVVSHLSEPDGRQCTHCLDWMDILRCVGRLSPTSMMVH